MFTIKHHILALAWLVTALAFPAHADTILPDHGRALSMRVLQERLQDCQGGACETAVTHLAHMKRIDGFVIDRENNDLILIGQVDPNWPKLHLDDLVTAMRSAWHRYVRWEGNTAYFSSPGVSIDPQPRVIKRLQQIGHYLNVSNSATAREQGLADWHQVCHLPQTVRIEGIPFHTRSAATMLHVDYDLKRIADGSFDTDIDNFHSLSSRYLEAAKQAIHAGTASRLSSMSRFWFYPGPLEVMADLGAAIIDPEFSLVVLTEEQHLNARGLIADNGQSNPLAEEFAQSVTRHYDTIASARPEWRELENLSWMVALARVMRQRSAFQSAGLDIGWLLDGYRQRAVSVDKTVPGHSNLESYDYRIAVDGGYVVGSLRLPSCGGVELAIDTSKSVFDAPAGWFEPLVKVVNRNRPSPGVLYWDF